MRVTSCADTSPVWMETAIRHMSSQRRPIRSTSIRRAHGGQHRRTVGGRAEGQAAHRPGQERAHGREPAGQFFGALTVEFGVAGWDQFVDDRDRRPQRGAGDLRLDQVPHHPQLDALVDLHHLQQHPHREPQPP
jgi:hypothetical protein